MCGFSIQHAALRNKRENWLTQNQNRIFEEKCQIDFYQTKLNLHILYKIGYLKYRRCFIKLKCTCTYYIKLTYKCTLQER